MPGMTRSRLWRLRSTIHSDVAEPLERGVDDGFPDVALVELGVADQGDEAGLEVGPEVGVDVAARGRGEQGRDGAEPDRPGREVETSGSFVRDG